FGIWRPGGRASANREALAQARKALYATEGAPESSTNEAKAANPAVVDRLAGAATFDLKTVEGERVVHLVFLAVRSRFRRAGLGSALLRSLKDPAIFYNCTIMSYHPPWSALRARSPGPCPTRLGSMPKEMERQFFANRAQQ
uniref:N-acetyltransferase domain-containing protein n=1 Tax=Macrostomum lignano TaxID=282301 RepID=A0A1I8FTY0_9PLAT